MGQVPSGFEYPLHASYLDGSFFWEGGDLYFSLLPKDIVRYCIIPYLDYVRNPDAFGSQLQIPRYCFSLFFQINPDDVDIYLVDRNGCIMYGDDNWCHYLKRFNPRTSSSGVIMTVSREDRNRRGGWQIWGYDPVTDGLILATDSGQHFNWRNVSTQPEWRIRRRKPAYISEPSGEPASLSSVPQHYIRKVQLGKTTLEIVNRTTYVFRQGSEIIQRGDFFSFPWEKAFELCSTMVAI